MGNSLVGPNKHKACGNVRTQNISSGYTNLIDHVTSEHADDYVEIMESYRSNEKESGPFDSFFIKKVSTKPKEFTIGLNGF